LLDYKEYLDMLGGEDEDEEVTDEKKLGDTDTSSVKVGAYGTDEMQQVISERRRAYQEKMHTEQIRQNAQQAELEAKIFEEELTASALRVGGANPRRFFPDACDENNTKNIANCNYYGAEFSFMFNKAPIRTIITGRKLEFCGMLHDKMRRVALARPILISCPGCSMKLDKLHYPDISQKCQSCHKFGYNTGSPAEYICKNAWKDGNSECYRYYICGPCFKAKKSEYLRELASIAKKETYAQCPVATTLSLLIPSEVIIGNAELGEKISNAVRSVIDLKEKDKLKVKHISKILANNLLCERVSHSTKAQHDLLVHNSSIHVSILSTYQTKCRLLICQREILEGRVKEGLNNVYKSGVLETLGSSHLPSLNHAAATKSALFSGTHSDVCFTAHMEFRMLNLPIADQRAALLRLEPPPLKAGRDSKRQEASIYIQKGGVLAGSQVEEIVDGEVCVKAGRWHLLTAVTDCISGVLNLYLDGTFVRTVTYSSKFNAPKLGLGSRLIVFGGGKQSESRGGEVRFIRLIDGALTKIQLDTAVTEIRAINPVYRDSATTIQALVRCIHARTRCITFRKSIAKELGLDPEKKLSDLNIKRNAIVKNGTDVIGGVVGKVSAGGKR